MTDAALQGPSPEPDPLLLGAHLSIAGGLHKAFDAARALECRALQIFTKNASTWKERILSQEEIDSFDLARKRSGIHRVAAHAAYLINICAADREIRQKSIRALVGELQRCEELAIPWLVLHPGSHKGKGESVGIESAADAIETVFQQVRHRHTRLLLETTAGQGSVLGKIFEELSALMDIISDHGRLGACLDTCHIFAAGYDISTSDAYEETMREFDRIVGISRLDLIHVNDCKKPCGSRVDRHAHIGQGMIGIEGFSCLVNDERLAGVPKILETPKEKDAMEADAKNLALLKKLYRRK